AEVGQVAPEQALRRQQLGVQRRVGGEALVVARGGERDGDALVAGGAGECIGELNVARLGEVEALEVDVVGGLEEEGAVGRGGDPVGGRVGDGADDLGRRTAARRYVLDLAGRRRSEILAHQQVTLTAGR